MTLEELQQLIDKRISERLNYLFGEFEIGEEELFADEEPDTRSWEQVQQDIERDRWTPPREPSHRLSYCAKIGKADDSVYR